MAGKKISPSDPRILRFCSNLVKGMDNVDAAVEAGYSREYAVKRASALRLHPVCQEILATMSTRVAETMVLDAVRVVNEMGAIAMTSPVALLVEDPRPTGDFYRWKRPDELTEMEKAAIKSVEVFDLYEERTDDKGNVVKMLVRQEYRYTLHDKMKALDSLGRHFNIYEEADAAANKSRLPDFSNMPHDKMMALMNYMQKLQSDEGAIDGEVLPDDRGHA